MVLLGKVNGGFPPCRMAKIQLAARFANDLFDLQHLQPDCKFWVYPLFTGTYGICKLCKYWK